MMSRNLVVIGYIGQAMVLVPVLVPVLVLMLVPSCTMLPDVHW